MVGVGLKWGVGNAIVLITVEIVGIGAPEVLQIEVVAELVRTGTPQVKRGAYSAGRAKGIRPDLQPVFSGRFLSLFRKSGGA